MKSQLIQLTSAPRLAMMFLLLLFLASCSSTSTEPNMFAFPLPAVIFHQSDQVVNPRVKDAKAFAAFIQQIQSRCDYYFSRTKPRNAQTVDVVVIVKPGNKSRIWLAYEQPQSDSARDRALLDKLKRVPAPSVEEGPVSFSMRLLLWGATEPNPRSPRSLFLPKEWRDAIGTNQAVTVPDGIMPQIWPGH